MTSSFFSFLHPHYLTLPSFIMFIFWSHTFLFYNLFLVFSFCLLCFFLLQAASTWRESCCLAHQGVEKPWWPGRLARCSTPVSRRWLTARRSSTSTWESLRPTSASCLPRQRRSRRGWETFLSCVVHRELRGDNNNNVSHKGLFGRQVSVHMERVVMNALLCLWWCWEAECNTNKFWSWNIMAAVT